MRKCPTQVIQADPRALKNQVFGIYGSSILPIQTDQLGRLDIRPLSSSKDSVTIQGTVVADTQPLSNSTDNLLVYGNDGVTNRAIHTDTSGNIVVAKTFIQSTQNVTTTDTLSGGESQDISLLSTVSFFVKNTGANPADIFIQVSPNNVDWVNNIFGGEVVQSNNQTVDSPSYFLQYARVAFKSTNPGNPTTLMIIFQAQA